MRHSFSKKWWTLLSFVTAAALVVAVMTLWHSRAQSQSVGPHRVVLSPIEDLGKRVFFQNISDPPRQACVTCHVPSAGFTSIFAGDNLHQVAMPGADPHRDGSLKPPTNACAPTQKFEINLAFLPAGFRGGAFWNGRAEGNLTPLFPPPATTPTIAEDVFQTANGQNENAAGEDLKTAYEKYLGPIADQALNPFLNPVEMNNATRQAVCEAVAAQKYAALFQEAWGEPIDCSTAAFDKSFRRIAVSLAAWQLSSDVRSFSSKRDIALQRELDGLDVDSTQGQFPLVGLTPQENLGHDLFYSTFIAPKEFDGVVKVTNCGICHAERPGIDNGTEPHQRYADDSFHNIGTPPNPEIPGQVVDPGLATHVGDVTLPPLPPPFPPSFTPNGFYKTPTLRNVDKRPGQGFPKAYTHNGWFKSLEALVHFYNTSRIGGATANELGITRCPPGIETEKEALANNCWPGPEFDTFGLAQSFGLIGDMNLTPEEEAAIVAYLKTLTDFHTVAQPLPYR